MKAMISKVCDWIFAVGCTVVILASVLSTLGFVAAFFTGQETASRLAAFLNIELIPSIALAAVAFSFFAMLKMYINKEQAFTIDSGED